MSNSKVKMVVVFDIKEEMLQEHGLSAEQVLKNIYLREDDVCDGFQIGTIIDGFEPTSDFFLENGAIVSEELINLERIKGVELSSNLVSVHGFSIVNSAGFEKGNESSSSLFNSSQECIREAYKAYCAIYNDALEEGILDQEDDCMSFDEFEKMLMDNGYAYIQFYDSHVQFEYFVKELELGLDLDKSIAAVENEKNEIKQNVVSYKNLYPKLSNTRDGEFIKSKINHQGLRIIEDILEAYGKDRIDIEVVRDKDEQIEFDKSGALIIKDKSYFETGFEPLVIKWYESMEDTGYLVECFDDFAKVKGLDEAMCLADDVCSAEDGHVALYIANIVDNLRSEADLSEDEILRLTERLFEAQYSSAAPLLTAERVDAALYLVTYGINENRFSDLPEATPDQAKEFLLNCDYDVFVDLIERVAVDNQEYYKPDYIGLDREHAVCEALREFKSKKPVLEDVIDSAQKQVLSNAAGQDAVVEPEL